MSCDMAELVTPVALSRVDSGVVRLGVKSFGLVDDLIAAQLLRRIDMLSSAVTRGANLVERL